MKISDTVQFIHKNKLFLFPVGCFVLLFLFSFYTREIVIYPGMDASKIITFDDHENNGNSELELFTIDSSGVTIQYVLRDGLQYPYIGFKLVQKEDSLFRDFSAYDDFVMDMSFKSPQSIDVFFHNNLPGYTDEKKVLTYHFLLKTFFCKQAEEHINVPLKSFTTPLWWWLLNKNLAEDLPDVATYEDSLDISTYKEVAEIIVQSAVDNTINKSYSFTMKKMSLRKDMKKRAFWTLGASAVWLLLYGILYLFYKNRTNKNDKKMVISYEQLVVSNDSDDCLNRILAYIAREYKNPELTVNKIASEVGVLPAKVTQILREKKNCSYKQYLNAIRLAEAKRLLLDTDRNIVDISLKVGYNNVTHFNRIFKEVEGISPRQFRAASDKQQSDNS